MRELLETKTSYGLEYTADGKVVSFLLGTSMLFQYGRTFEINDLAVDPAYQGRGIASALVEQIARLYVTHPGVTADKIMTKMGL